MIEMCTTGVKSTPESGVTLVHKVCECGEMILDSGAKMTYFTKNAYFILKNDARVGRHFSLKGRHFGNFVSCLT